MTETTFYILILGLWYQKIEIFEENLEERILEQAPDFCGGYYDSYYIKPNNSKAFKDKYLIVTTLKDTKEIIEIKIVTKEQIDAFSKKDIFANQKTLIKNLFK